MINRKKDRANGRGQDHETGITLWRSKMELTKYLSSVKQDNPLGLCRLESGQSLSLINPKERKSKLDLFWVRNILTTLANGTVLKNGCEMLGFNVWNDVMVALVFTSRQSV